MRSESNDIDEEYERINSDYRIMCIEFQVLSRKTNRTKKENDNLDSLCEKLKATSIYLKSLDLKRKDKPL